MLTIRWARRRGPGAYATGRHRPVSDRPGRSARNRVVVSLVPIRRDRAVEPAVRVRGGGTAELAPTGGAG